jgi:hypothetical protein
VLLFSYVSVAASAAKCPLSANVISFSVVILLFIVYSRRRRPDSYVVGVDPDDDVRENIINYDEEGVGKLCPN